MNTPIPLHRLLCALFPLVDAMAAAPVGPTGIPLVQGSYAVIDLGNFGKAQAQAFALNDEGQVTGHAQDTNGNYFGFRWDRGALRRLPTFADGTPVTGFGINSNGTVAGAAWDPLNGAGPVKLAFTWSGGPLVMLPRPVDGGHSEALAINGSGVAAGYTVVTQAGPLGPVLIARPTRWAPDGAVSLLTGAAMAQGRAFGINEVGDIVGTFQNRHPDHTATHAVIFEPGGVRDLHTVDYHLHSVGVAINAARQVVGYSYTDTSGVFDQPFYWDATNGMRRLPRPPSSPYGRATSITDNHLAAGDLRNDGPVLWLDVGRTNETYVLARSLLPRGSPYRVQGPVAVNRWGEIAASAGYDGFRAVLLTPTNLVHRIEGSIRLATVSLEPDGTRLATTNALADLLVELLALDGTRTWPIAAGHTDAAGAFTLLARQGAAGRYAVRFTLRDGSGWLDLLDVSSDATQAAWLRTPDIEPGPVRQMEVELGINLDPGDPDPNEVTFRFNGQNYIVMPAANAAVESPASNATVRNFPHLAALYRNLRLAAAFAEDQLGLDLPRLRIEAFAPGAWKWEAWQNTTNANRQVRTGQWKPVSHFSRSSPNSPKIVFPDLESLFNPPANGHAIPGNTNGYYLVAQERNRTTGITTTTGGTLAARNRPDNREFHEFAHWIMYVSPIGGVNGFPSRLPGEANHAGFNNATTTDSWTEGWAEFLSAVISEAMLSAEEKPRPHEYLIDGTSVNLDDLLTYNDVVGIPGDEELLVAATLWDLHDGPGGPDDDPLHVPVSDWWRPMAEGGPNLTNFHAVYQAFAGLAAAQPTLLPPALWDQRLIAAYVWDDKTYPAADPRYLDIQYSPGERLGMTSWNRRFPQRPRMVATQFLGVTSVGGSTDETTFQTEIQYDPPFEARNSRVVHTTVGSGEHLLPVYLPPLPSRAVVTARRGDQAALAPWVILSADFWEVPREPAPEDPETPFVALRHTFVFPDAAPELHANRQPDGAIELVWPAGGGTWELEESPVLGAFASWSPVAAEPVLTGERWRVTRPTGGTTLFYRLRAR